ncbi:MAG: Patatin [Chthonomonadaceae bacterium]|nr:Patatin [Chthonomonadaceae bacterium]
MKIQAEFQEHKSKQHRRFGDYRTALVLALAFFCLAARAEGQTVGTKPRPKIGLALSGGAAYGLAHIGVLEWFEQHHIPVDYLAGTSMGGLIGGAHCMGMTPEEMRSLIKSIDWNDALRAGPGYQNLSFRRKEDERDLASRLVVGLRHGVSLPEGFIPGNSIGLLLSRISLPYSEIPDFDALPTPFRCIAVDLNKGEAIALKKGSLATALRATMALPAIFTPVERDGRLLVDGGTLNNIPTEAVKEMGADIIIAVDLSASLFDQKQGGSLMDVLGRTINVRTYANERRSLKLADIILTPELARLSGTDFLRVDTFAEKGYQAAEDKARVLERFALSDAEWEIYVAQRNSRKRSEIAAPTFVQPQGVDGKTTKALESRLKSFVNAPLNIARLEKELTAITGEGHIESFQYQQSRRNGKQGLLLYADPKRYGPPLLRFGLEVNGADTDNIRTNFATRLIALDAGGPGVEVRADLRLGSDKKAALEYYRPLGSNRRWFLAPRLFYSDEPLNLFHQGTRVAIYGNRSAGGGLDLGYNAGRLSELRLGYQYHDENASVRTGSPLLASVSGGVSKARLQWIYDGLDSPMIPSQGNRLQLEGDWYFQAPGSSKSYPAAQLNLTHFTSLRNGDSIFSLAGIGTTFGNQAAPLQQFTVGGPLSLGASGLDEFRGNDYLHMTLGYLHRLATLPSVLGGKVMVGSWYDFGGAAQRFTHTRYLNDISVGFLAETLVGPVIVGYSYGEHGRSNTYFSIGRFF